MEPPRAQEPNTVRERAKDEAPSSAQQRPAARSPAAHAPHPLLPGTWNMIEGVGAPDEGPVGLKGAPRMGCLANSSWAFLILRVSGSSMYLMREAISGHQSQSGVVHVCNCEHHRATALRRSVTSR